MVHSNGFRPDEADSEIIPLTTVPTYTTYDEHDEHLPTYGEAVNQDPDPKWIQQTIETGSSSAEILPARRSPTIRTRKSWRPSRVEACLACVAFLGVSLIGVGIFRGIHYVNNIAYPTPPTATFPNPVSPAEIEFMMSVILGTALLYLVLLRVTLLLFPNFLLPVWVLKWIGANRRWRSRQREPQKNDTRRNCRICSGLSFLYLGCIVSAIMAPVLLVNSKQRNINSVYLAEDVWAGSYVLLSSTADGFSGLQFSRNGAPIGEVVFSFVLGGWSIETTNGSNQTIVYTNPGPALNQTDTETIQFNVSCNIGSADTCAIGGQVDQPPQYPGADYTGHPDFAGNITLLVTSPDSVSPLNTTSNENVWTSFLTYQGVGETYAPLGYWYLGNSPIIHVSWIASADGPCQGLQINLSKDFEGVAWIVLGLVWQWWILWGENYGGCINWATSYTTTINGLPLGTALI